MPVFKLEELRAPEISALPRDRTVFFIPVGPIEDHGSALPVTLDTKEAQALSEACGRLLAAEGWNIIHTPAVPMGVDSNTSVLAIRVRAHVLRDYLVDFCDSLAKAGFRYFICVSGHPGPRQLTTIEDAGKFLRKRYLRFGLFPGAHSPILVSASSVIQDLDEKSRTPFFMVAPEHGGKRDASIALAVGAGQATSTDPALLKTLIAVPEPTEGILSRWFKWKKGEVQGYWGNPQAGSALLGQQSIEEKAKTIFVKFKAVTQGGKATHVFKSWYSIIPSNQSLFRIWILVALLAILFGGWTFYALQAFLAGADFR